MRSIALERFRLDHDRGSSYGDSRIVRRVYPDPLYTGLMAEPTRSGTSCRRDARLTKNCFVGRAVSSAARQTIRWYGRRGRAANRAAWRMKF